MLTHDSLKRLVLAGNLMQIMCERHKEIYAALGWEHALELIQQELKK